MVDLETTTSSFQSQPSAFDNTPWLIWYCVWVTIPSSHLERVMTSPEVERSKFLVPLGGYAPPTNAYQAHVFLLNYPGKILEDIRGFLRVVWRPIAVPTR